jgi:signal transduction histidine kinase
MRLREPGTKSTLLVFAVLLILLPLLAVLQYRWQSQLSEREQEHMKINLRAIAQRFEQDLDDEIARAYTAFFLPSDQASDEKLVEYSKRYDRWLSTTQHPKLVKDLFVVRAEQTGQLYVSQLDIEHREFNRIDWPERLGSLRVQFAKFLDGEPRPSMRELMSNRVRPMSESEIALINPSFAPQAAASRNTPASPSLAAFVVVVVNQTEIEQEMLPALAKRHFASTQAFDYGAEVVGPAPERKLIYHFGPEVPGRAEPDVSVGLLGLGRDSFRRVMLSLPTGEPVITSPRVIAQPDRPAAGAQNSARPRRAEASRPGPEDEPRLWELRLTHRSGSLEAAVVSIRRRNLLISFGILAILVASVALMMISARRAQALAKRQLDFVAGVSHELRTPLAVIKSAAWSLTRGVVKDPSGIKRYSELIGSESDRLIDMIEQVLEYAGARSGNQKLDLQPTDVSHLIEEVLAAAQPLLTEGGFVVEKRVSPELPLVLAQASALSRALRNLIDNAMKYSGDSRWIGVVAEATQGVGRGEVRISIIDRGPGIPANEVSHIFDPFWRGSEATAAQIHGNGLGLNLVKTIVEAHQGDVSVRSTPGNGSSFSIVLPALREEMRDSSPVGVHSLESDAAR